jgi:hypothetical protein
VPGALPDDGGLVVGVVGVELGVVGVVPGVMVIGVGVVGLGVVVGGVAVGGVVLMLAEAPVKSTIKVSIRVAHPNAVSGPRAPSQMLEKTAHLPSPEICANALA